MEERLAELEVICSAQDLWDDQQQAQQFLSERAKIQSDLSSFRQVQSEYEQNVELLDLVVDDDDLSEQIEKSFKDLEIKIKLMEVNCLFSSEADGAGCFLEIHAGAGGTESNDWAAMLLRMYTRWAEIYHGFKIEIVDKLDGEEVGIKSITIKILGERAYGWAKVESGIHRLVRISPFDANAKRHTSFASVGVSPILDDKIDIEINPKDLRIDTFRASGAGGQHVNKTESAIRITYLPTGMAVQCQNSRSQHKNRAEAYSILRARLYAIEMQKREQKIAEEHGKKCDIGWGNQIRSYVMQPYQMVKDLRTGFEVGNINSVFDGNLDPIMMSVLTNRNT